MKLSSLQRRVLGVLIEKSLATPAAYPLTLNAVTAGCNQLSCRDPVMKLSEDEAARGLRELQERRLAAEERGARSERYRHNAEEHWGGNQFQLAILAELLLRGPQTPGELKANASRMAPFPDLGAVTMILDAFAAQGLARELPRQPGKAAARFDHCLYEEETPAPPPPDSLEARVARLEADVAALREEIRRVTK
jgi:hypothetical protein